MHSDECCLDEDEFEEQIRLSKDARAKMLGKGHNQKDDNARDPIGDADRAGKRKYYEADMMWLRAARMDHTAIFYLEDRAKTCYKLRTQPPSHNAVLNCYKDVLMFPQKTALDCECEVRNFLQDVMHEKIELSAAAAKYGKTDKKKDNKDDKKSKK